jgi:RNA polymerase sporulation-specific sigma factor
LTHEGNQSQLIERAQAGDPQAMDAMVRTHLALVKYIVRRYLNRGREYDDLYQMGCLGLVKAIRNFDTSYDVRFSTYAVPVILGEIRRFLRDDSPMRVSRSIKENAVRVYRFIEEYEAENAGEPGLDEIASALGISREDALLALDSARPTRSFSEPVGADGSLTLGDVIGEDATEEIDNRLTIEALLKRLDEKERVILLRRYFSRHTQSEIALDMGMTQVQVSRMESKIIARLRREAAGDDVKTDAYAYKSSASGGKSSVAK